MEFMFHNLYSIVKDSETPRTKVLDILSFWFYNTLHTGSQRKMTNTGGNFNINHHSTYNL